MQRITLTGADERTDVQQLISLVDRYPEVEVGLLYTATPEGRNRYPSLPWLKTAAKALAGRCAVHVCGGTARRQLIAGDLDELTGYAPRIQVNGILTADELVACAARVGTLITQHHDKNASLVAVSLPNHSLLIDGSGGRGISPTGWFPPVTHKPVGFAGGMGPDNLTAELGRILPVAKDNAWVDMEGKLRTEEDWFNIELADYCAMVFSSTMLQERVLAKTNAAAPRRAAKC